MLDPSGPFGISNAFPDQFGPGQKLKILFNFTPLEQVHYHESVQVQCFYDSKLESSIRINVRGQGLLPKCTIEGTENGKLDLGTASVNQQNSTGFLMKNTTDFDLQYRYFLVVRNFISYKFRITSFRPTFRFLTIIMIYGQDVDF